MPAWSVDIDRLREPDVHTGAAGHRHRRGGAGCSAAAAGAAARCRGGSGGGGLRTELDGHASSANLRDLAAVEEDANGLAVAADELPSTTLPDRSCTVSADTAHAAPATSSSAVSTAIDSSVHECSVTSLDDGQRRRDLQIDDQLQLVLDLQEPQAVRGDSALRRGRSKLAFTACRSASRSSAPVASVSATASVIVE